MPPAAVHRADIGQRRLLGLRPRAQALSRSMTSICSAVPDRPAAECTITLDALSGQAGVSATWPGDVSVPPGSCTWTVDGITVGGGWHPQSRTYTASSRQTSARFGLASRPEAIEGQLTDDAYLRGQLAALRGSPWHAHLGRAAALASDPPPSALIALSDLLLADLPDPPASLADYARALADYQLGIDPASDATALRLISLVAAGTVATPPPRVSEWVRESDYSDAATVAIECRYQHVDGSIQTYSAGTGQPPRRVEDPAASRAEAYLEIALQRLRLLAETERGLLTTPLDLGLAVGMSMSYDGADWVIVRLVHQDTRERVPTTRITLRPIPPPPGPVPADLQTPPQRDLLNPP